MKILFCFVLLKSDLVQKGAKKILRLKNFINILGRKKGERYNKIFKQSYNKENKLRILPCGADNFHHTLIL